ncbi:MAG: peptidoglycan DD-metalloendopeptidase family protein [Thermoanaerobaculia bacterium]|nr:MAG: peptidoglycan DD-metalloendopeptidase family protein [Thermoanaerobaculia bacterium]MBZ0102950.1 peptidoglycan DD-metalloendopeptidase family protein [Thermoanaerobaculia bacterium]
MSLPLGGLLALAVVVEAPWDEGMVAATALETAALDPLGGLEADAVSSSPRGLTEAPPARSAELKRGETLGQVLASLNLTPAEAHRVVESARAFADPRQLRPGTRWAAWNGPAGEVERFDLVLAGRGEVRVERRQEAWEANFRPFEREVRRRSVRGSLEGSLESSIARAGADGTLAYVMDDVLQWDLDFSRDLQPGDRFAVLFEEIWVEGAFTGFGEILALTYSQSNGRQLEAYRYAEAGAYYDAEGRPLEKMFLRSPMAFSRVTSRFSNRRFHPVLKVFRPHYGVDYGAPVGTPVRATASGTVLSAGWDGGGGKTVKIRHPNDYLTCYLHLSRFADGVRSGKPVRQGDVIGYVGATGLATAAHLDYRVQQRGKWIDPLSLGGVPAEPLTSTRLADFRVARAAMQESLHSGAAFDPSQLSGTSTRLAAAAPAVADRARK